jgi:hypothetical protein
MRPGQAYQNLLGGKSGDARGYGPYADGYRLPPNAAAPTGWVDALRSLDPKAYAWAHSGETPEAIDADLQRMGLKPEPASDAISGPKPRVGGLSMAYETGYPPGHEAQAAARLSTNRKDPGGASYGAYQMASSRHSRGVVQAFLGSEGAPWADRFQGLDPREYGGAFGEAWRKAAQEDPQRFFDAQHAFIARTHYNPVVERVRQRTGVDIKSLSPAVQDVVWSMSVQHGGAAHLVTDAVGGLRGRLDSTDPGYDRALIDSLYDRREAYVRRLGQPELVRRFEQERRDAQAMAH